jgi:hypothetical protein
MGHRKRTRFGNGGVVFFLERPGSAANSKSGAERMSGTTAREIPYKYTSADDRRILAPLLGDEVLAPLDRLVFELPLPSLDL